ncbi:uncharacterized protein [Rutidosis leptorrhynchoides]|uniref:uncharacterized protein n=1 Tax=Rutidosis leptorrhynchoides TaxID=125765 RepID=UPI003A991833
MDNRLKLTFTKIFESCRPKNTSDISDQPFFFPENHHHRQLIDLFSPKPHSFLKPECDIEFEPKPIPSLPKTFERTPKFPAVYVCRKPEKSTKNKPHYRTNKNFNSFKSETDNYYYDWRNDDEESDSDDETTIFSSRSFSSDSSNSFRKNRTFKKPQKKSNTQKDDKLKHEKLKRSEKSGKLVKDSFAVVKKSSNPHEDFKVSMLEMIVEQEMYGSEELENLLECFISLNSEEHHRVIFDVFIEIWDALFSDLV